MLKKETKFICRGGKGLTCRLPAVRVAGPFDGLARRPFGGFTIIELLTVMSIIIIIISLLVPGLNRARKFAKDMAQKAQFYEIGKALADYRNDHQDEYPDSNRLDYDDPRMPYCGAMKLCEALVGQDGMGFNPDSRLLASGLDASGVALYLFDLCTKTDPATIAADTALQQNVRKRIRYLENPNTKAVRLDMLYGTPNPAPYESSGVCAVLTDVYNRATIDGTACQELAGEKVGMPILYYKADVRKFSLDANDTLTNPKTDNIYDFRDNHDLVALGLPWDTATIPPMGDTSTTPPGPTTWFYERITNPAVTATPTPFNKEDYILISAGYDGVFGTHDDIFNFRR